MGKHTNRHSSTNLISSSTGTTGFKRIENSVDIIKQRLKDAGFSIQELSFLMHTFHKVKTSSVFPATPQWTEENSAIRTTLGLLYNTSKPILYVFQPCDTNVRYVLVGNKRVGILRSHPQGAFYYMRTPGDIWKL